MRVTFRGMMYALFLACLLFTNIAWAQNPARMAPLASSGTITAFTVSQDTLYAAGERGHFFVWENGLKQLAFPDDHNITSMAAAGQTIWAVGYNEMIAQRIGSEWVQKNKEFKADSILFSVHFTSEKKGLAVGKFGIARQTFDGDTWNEVDLGVQDANLYQIKSDTKGNWYIAGEFGNLLKLSGEMTPLKKFGTSGRDKGTYFGLEVLGVDDCIAYGLQGRIIHFKNDTDTHVSNPLAHSLYTSLKIGSDVLLFGAEGTCLLYRNGSIIDKSIKDKVAIIDAVIFEDTLFLGTVSGIRTLPLAEILK